MLAPFAGIVVAIRQEEWIGAGEALVVLEAMKMEHEVLAQVDGLVRSVEVAIGDTVEPGQCLAVLEPAPAATGADPRQDEPAATVPSRDDLATVRARHAMTLDDARPDAIARRRKQGRRTCL